MLQNQNETELTSEQKIKKIKLLLSKDDCDIIEILDLNKNIKFSSEKEEANLKELIWNKEFDMIFNNKATIVTSKYPSMLIINHLLNQAYDYKLKDINKVKYLESLRESGLNIIKKIKKCKNIDEIEKIKKETEDLNINLEDYFVKRETKIKVAKIRQKSVESSDLSSAEKLIEKKSKKYKKLSQKNVEENKEIEILSEKNENNVINLIDNNVKDYYGIGPIENSNSQAIKISDMDEDSMEIEEVIQIDENKNNRKKNKELELKENEDDDIIIEDNFIKNEIIITKNKKNINNNNDNKKEKINGKDINNKISGDEEEINKILNKKTKRNKLDFQTHKSNNIINNNSNINKNTLLNNNSLYKKNNSTYIKQDLNKNKNKKKLNIPTPIFKPKNNKTKNSLEDYKIESNVDKQEKKEKIRKNALINITKILNGNPYFKDKGETFINNLAKNVEEDLAKLYPNIEIEYHKTLNNMYLTLKEIAKYKNINQKIIENKISLFKIAKFNFGDKFIEKLKKANEMKKHPKIIKKGKNNNISIHKFKEDNDKDYNKILDNYSPIKNYNKSENNNNNNNAKFSPTKLFSSSKLFNISSIGEEMHLYEPLSKEKLEYKEFMPILYDPDDEQNTNKSDNESMENDEEYEENEVEKDDENTLKTDNLNRNENQEEIREDENINNKDNTEKNENTNMIIDDMNNQSKFNSHNFSETNKEQNDSNSLFNTPLNNHTLSTNLFSQNNSIHPPKGSILRIFHGKIRMNHNNIKKVSILSTNNCEKILKFPKLEDDLVLSSKAKTKEVIPYCIKHLKNKSRIILYGWLEPDLTGLNEIEKNIEINKFIDIINEFEIKDKTSCLINQKIKLYIFVINDNNEEFNSKIISKIDFINSELGEKIKQNKKFLVFTMLSNKNDLDSDYIIQQEKINPEIIKIKENNDLNDDSNKNYEEDNEFEDENQKLKNLFSQKDFDINAYAEKNFKNLSAEEMSSKLLKLDEENRFKLIEMIQKYISKQNNDKPDINNNSNSNNNSNNNIFNSTQNLNSAFYSCNTNLMNNMNNIYMNPMNKNKNQNMNINMNINNINNGSLLYYNQPMNIYGNFNQNYIK